MIESMNRQDVIARLCQLAAEQAGVDASGVTSDTHLFNDLNYDSLDVVEFTMTIEDAFDVNIPDDAADGVKTVGHAADLLASALSSRAR